MTLPTGSGPHGGSPQGPSRNGALSRRQLGIRFSSEINLGHLLAVISMVGTLVALWRNMETRLAVLETRESNDRQAIEQISSTLRSVNLNEDRLTENQARLTALLEEHLRDPKRK